MTFALYLKLVRWKNLALLVYLLCLLRFILLNTYQIPLKLHNIQFLFLVLSIVSIAGAGYIINDIKDVIADSINKPKQLIVGHLIGLEQAKRWYFFTNSLGVISGVGLTIQMQTPSYSFLFLLSAFLLFMYSHKLKSMPIIGNIVVSLLIVMVVLLFGLFELGGDWFSNENKELAWVLLFLMGFAFFLNLVREIIKDIIDVNGDKKLNMWTLPILIGRQRCQNLAAFLCVFPLGLLLYIFIKYSLSYKFTISFLLIFCFLPLLVMALKLITLDNFDKLKLYSNYLKVIMFLGITSLLLIQYS